MLSRHSLGVAATPKHNARATNTLQGAKKKKGLLEKDVGDGAEGASTGHHPRAKSRKGVEAKLVHLCYIQSIVQ